MSTVLRCGRERALWDHDAIGTYMHPCRSAEDDVNVSEPNTPRGQGTTLNGSQSTNSERFCQ